MPIGDAPSWIRLGDLKVTREEIYELVQVIFGPQVVDQLGLQELNLTSCAGNVQLAGMLGLANPQVMSIQNGFREIIPQLQQGKVVVVRMTLASGGDHCFCIVPSVDNGKYTGMARVVHAYEDMFLLQQQKELPISELANQLDVACNGDSRAFTEVFGRETPFEVMKLKYMNAADEMGQRVPYVPYNGNQAMNELNAQMMGRARLAEQEFAAWQNRNRMTQGGVIGAALGFSLALVSVLVDQDHVKTKSDKAEEVALRTVEGAAGGVAGAAAAAYVPSADVAGSLVSRGALAVENAAGCAAAAAVAVSAIDVTFGAIQLARSKWSIVEYRRRSASSLAGAAGGLGGTVAGTALAAVTLSNPVGWAALGLAAVVGVAGGIGGSYAGAKLDEWLWDSDLDHFEHMFWFFGLGAFHRDPIEKQIPKTQAEVDRWMECIKSKFQERDSGWSEEEQQAWIGLCAANLLEFLSKANAGRWGEYMKQVERLAEAKAGLQRSLDSQGLKQK